jgi:hypothetical protein
MLIGMENIRAVPVRNSEMVATSPLRSAESMSSIAVLLFVPNL